MIRPTGVKLTVNGSDERHLSGRVTDVAFRGRGYEHAIDINGNTRLTASSPKSGPSEGRSSACAWIRPAVTCSRPNPKDISAERAVVRAVCYVLTSRNTVKLGTCLTSVSR